MTLIEISMRRIEFNPGFFNLLPLVLMIFLEFSTIDSICTSGTHGCHRDANCFPTKRSHKCVCKPGFRGDGRLCEGSSMSLVLPESWILVFGHFVLIYYTSFKTTFASKCHWIYLQALAFKLNSNSHLRLLSDILK